MTSDEIDQRLRSLYGEVDWGGATGVVQVAAIGGRDRRMIVPGEQAPVSGTDRFVLAAARARADAFDDLGGKKAALRLPEEQAQHLFLRGREQCICQ